MVPTGAVTVVDCDGVPPDAVGDVVVTTEPGAMKAVGVESVTAPVAADAVISLAVPAIDVTPVLENVTAPVAADTPMPVPATALVTPELVIVRPPVTVEIVIPVPAVNAFCVEYQAPEDSTVNVEV